MVTSKRSTRSSWTSNRYKLAAHAVACVALLCARQSIALATATGPAKQHELPGQLSAAQIVQKNVAARGGLEAWRKIKTMVWIGHLESEHAPQPSMGFILEQARPNKTRFQLIGMKTRTVRAFNGIQGWKTRASQDGRSSPESYTTEELRFAQTAPGLDGPLIDSAAKGYSVSLDGSENIEGHKVYRLIVQLPGGERDQVWVDAQSFLDVRYDRPFHGSGSTSHTVSVLYRSYKFIDGVQVPSEILTGAAPGRNPDRMVIERVVMNAPLGDRIFGDPLAAPPAGSSRMPPSLFGGATTGRRSLKPPPFFQSSARSSATAPSSASAPGGESKDSGSTPQ